jgi:drug/metabolite transporter (DMT)-like permease
MNAPFPELVEYRVEYLRTIRALHAGKRLAGLVLSLAGVLMLIWGSQRTDAPPFAREIGVGLIAVGWLLFVYVIVMRTRYVRANPFEPKR